MGHVGSKTRSQGQTLEKFCVHPRRHIFSLIIMKLGKNICLSNFKNNLVYTLRGHIFRPMIMKYGQNVYLDEISDKFENGSYWVKN